MTTLLRAFIGKYLYNISLPIAHYSTRNINLFYDIVQEQAASFEYYIREQLYPTDLDSCAKRRNLEPDVHFSYC